MVDSAPVSIAGTNAAQSAAGIQQAEKAEARSASRAAPQKAKRAPHGADEYDTFVRNTESPEAVRNLAGNDQEQAHEDRQEHPPHYLPDGTLARPGPAKRIDFKG